MHKHILNIIPLLFALLSLSNNAQPHRAAESVNNFGKLSVIITGFDNNFGKCRFALDNSEKIFESEDSVFIGKILPIIEKQVIVTIDSLQYGKYAIRVFHDENSNGKLDTDFLGIPTEDYGYSNNASSWFGPPSWEKAKFIFNQRKMQIEISVD